MITFKQFVAEGYKKYATEDIRAEHDQLKKTWQKAIRQIHELYGGYAAVLGYLYDKHDTSHIEIVLPAPAFDKEELEPDIVKIGIAKAFKDHGFDIELGKHKIVKDKHWSGKANWVLELEIKPVGKTAEWLNSHHHSITGSLTFRKRKR